MSEADLLWMARSRKKADMATAVRTKAPNLQRASDTHRIAFGVLLAALLVLGVAMAAVSVLLILASDAVRNIYHRRTSSQRVCPVEE